MESLPLSGMIICEPLLLRNSSSVNTLNRDIIRVFMHNELDKSSHES